MSPFHRSLFVVSADTGALIGLLPSLVTLYKSSLIFLLFGNRCQTLVTHTHLSVFLTHLGSFHCTWVTFPFLLHSRYVRAQVSHLFFPFQDMNGMQRETRGHVEEELEWSSGFFIMSHLISILGLTVQVASSDPELFKMVLSETRQVRQPIDLSFSPTIWLLPHSVFLNAILTVVSI